MNRLFFGPAFALIFHSLIISDPLAAQEMAGRHDTTKAYSYEKDVAPIINTYCISCHGTDNDNPSEYYMDDYDAILKGGRHGIPIIPGKPDSSMFYYKLLPNPPFGKEMPRGHKKITAEAVKVIHDWILQGAKKQ